MSLTARSRSMAPAIGRRIHLPSRSTLISASGSTCCWRMVRRRAMSFGRSAAPRRSARRVILPAHSGADVGHPEYGSHLQGECSRETERDARFEHHHGAKCSWHPLDDHDTTRRHRRPHDQEDITTKKKVTTTTSRPGNQESTTTTTA